MYNIQEFKGVHTVITRRISTVFSQTTVYSFYQLKGSILYLNDVNRLQEKL